ncbi:MAG: FkbM family methyltransferase [Gemmataceae bacterium]|nr:FkbM family methyltransferase [Gemmataceae bacterium]
MQLPICRHRRPAAESGRFECVSPLLRLAESVPESICAGCPFPDLVEPPIDALRPFCISRGTLQRREQLNLEDGRIEVDLYSCGRHGECTVSRWRDGIACCAVCPDYRPRDTAPETMDDPANSLDAMIEALRGPRRSWPDDWPWWGTTVDGHRRLVAEYIANLPPYPRGKYQGRGIVILGGGVFFPGVYVTVRMIRHHGCRLPIEVWHHAQSEPIYAHWLEPYGVRCLDLDEHMDAHGAPRIRGGWANKFYAVLHSSFEEVLYLDSDCYPAGDLTPIFDLNTHGALFWPDLPGLAQRFRPDVFAGDRQPIVSLQGGQFLLTKQSSWPGLVLAQWWNERADFAYHHGFGDQDVLRGAWQALRLPYRMCAQASSFDKVGIVAYGPDNKTPLLAHRTVDKFRLPFLSMRDSSATEDFLHHHYLADDWPCFQATFPGEREAFAFYREFLDRLNARPPWYRPDGADEEIHREVVVNNAYRLPDRVPKDAVVVDVGAHIGTFSFLALCRGAGRVWAFEPDPDNYQLCRKNLALFGPRAQVRRQAIWSHHGRLGFTPHAGNTGMGTVHAGGDDIDAVPLDDILWEASEHGGRRIDYLKLDCELAEWPILFNARRLGLCRNIVGEYHNMDWQGQSCGPGELADLLAAQGFDVETAPYSPAHGLFWARRA